MNVAALESLFRTQVDDVNTPYLISADDFLEYLNEAQEEACIRSCLLFDRSSELTKVPLLTGVDSYTLDPRIYAIVRASVIPEPGCVLELDIVERIELDRLWPDWRSETEAPRFLIRYDDHIEVAPVPDSDMIMDIEVYLLPELLTSSASTPQINPVNHRSLLHWVKHRAFSAYDNDILDLRRSEKEFMLFENIFGNRPTANNMRDQFANLPHKNKLCPIN